MIIPLQNFLVIEQEANEDKLSSGGIWIPQEKNPAKQFEGTIVAIGPFVKDPALKPGTRIALNAWGQVIRRKEETTDSDGIKHLREYVITREIDIVAILTADIGVKVGKMEAIMDSIKDA